MQHKWYVLPFMHIVRYIFIKKITQFTRDWVRGIGKKIVDRLDYCLPFNSKSASAYSSNNLLMYV